MSPSDLQAMNDGAAFQTTIKTETNSPGPARHPSTRDFFWTRECSRSRGALRGPGRAAPWATTCRLWHTVFRKTIK